MTLGKPHPVGAVAALPLALALAGPGGATAQETAGDGGSDDPTLKIGEIPLEELELVARRFEDICVWVSEDPTYTTFDPGSPLFDEFLALAPVLYEQEGDSLLGAFRARDVTGRGEWCYCNFGPGWNMCYAGEGSIVDHGEYSTLEPHGESVAVWVSFEALIAGFKENQASNGILTSERDIFRGPVESGSRPSEDPVWSRAGKSLLAGLIVLGQVMDKWLSEHPGDDQS